MRAGLIIALCLIPLLCTSCGSKPQTYMSPGGLQVMPLVTTPSDLAQALDVHTWRFDVTLPQSVRGVECKVEARPKGKSVIGMAGIGISAMDSKGLPGDVAHFLVTIAPTQQAQLDKSPQVRMFVGMQSGSTSAVRANPLQNMNIGGGGEAMQMEDGSFLLLTGSKSQVMWPDAAASLQRNDAVLVCTFRAMRR